MDLARIIELARRGATEEQIAIELGMDMPALKKAVLDFTEISEEDTLLYEERLPQEVYGLTAEVMCQLSDRVHSADTSTAELTKILQVLNQMRGNDDSAKSSQLYNIILQSIPGEGNHLQSYPPSSSHSIVDVTLSQDKGNGELPKL